MMEECLADILEEDLVRDSFQRLGDFHGMIQAIMMDMATVIEFDIEICFDCLLDCHIGGGYESGDGNGYGSGQGFFSKSRKHSSSRRWQASGYHNGYGEHD